MRFNLKDVTGKMIDLNPAQVVTRSMRGVKNELNKDMKMIERNIKDDEKPDAYYADITTTNPNIFFSFKCTTYEEAESLLKMFKEDL